MLRDFKHPVVAIGLRGGVVGDVSIETGFPELPDINTITLYVGPQNQPQYYDYLIGLKPKRIIFNPGTQNPEFEDLLRNNGIATIEHCTLVMLAEGSF